MHKKKNTKRNDNVAELLDAVLASSRDLPIRIKKSMYLKLFEVIERTLQQQAKSK